MSNVPSQDETGRTGSHGECSAAPEPLEEAAALAVELRGRLDDLRWGCWDGDCDAAVLGDGLAGLDALRAAVPALRTVSYWSDSEAVDVGARMDRRARAAIRSLEARSAPLRAPWHR